ncbi:hypothetical protein CHLNCDRAFT_137260 [Chlorella variabilis]|uniref:Uncharacterized protein n=1 Tax=Chlorella variabilis TaxID=554065 RepID=E1ZM22_CHLVA|nr:hypothetical protein CHLNCDRAFT_137260 [Chlorella variabilis]EFN52929.1 hypothetical protein CHLNCDRAFT_137260 [Chlorella variabilis]|eukprot:XP_005845031.1 hypothetical protein CHLNCDRAFT_137260 [Chlorella variabilis]
MGSEPAPQTFQVVWGHSSGEPFAVHSLRSAADADLVRDVLDIKEAVNAGQPVEALQLRSPYGPPNLAIATGGGSAARDASFRQLVEQLQECAVQLAAAAEHNAAAVAVVLAAAPQAATATDGCGWMPLHRLAQTQASVPAEQTAAAVKALVEAAPATLTAGDRLGRTPAHYAEECQNVPALEALLAVRPASAMTPDNYGWNPLQRALRRRNAAALIPLVEAVAAAAAAAGEDGLVLLQRTAQHQNAALMQPAVAATAAVERHGKALLHLAAERPGVAALQLLLAAGWGDPCAVSNHPSPQESARHTPLHCAVQHGNAPAVQLLVRAAPATTLVADKHGNTPLHLAAALPRAAVTELLLAAAPQAATLRGGGHLGDEAGAAETPLEVALRHRHLAVARRLLGYCPQAEELAALAAAGPAAHPLFADFVIARVPLSEAQWAQVPSPCPSLGRALPAAFAHSPAQARQVVRRLAPADAHRLRTFALALGRAQTMLGIQLPDLAVQRALSFFAA